MLKIGAPPSDTPLVSGSAPSWSVVVQCVVAGVVVGLCALHATGWRGGLRRAEAFWTVTWALALAAVSLVNGLLVVAPAVAQDALLLVRFLLVAAALVMSVPAVRVYTGGPLEPRPIAAMCVWYVAAVVLWVTTDLVAAHRWDDGLPVYGPLWTAALLVPLLVVARTVHRSLHGRIVEPVGATVAVGGTVSAVVLIASAVPPPSAVTELLAGLWVVPLIVVLLVVTASRTATVRRDALRRAGMRDVLSTVTNDAWLLRSPEQTLERAVTEARRLLGDTSIEGTIRPLSRDRFVTELFSGSGRPDDPVDAAFLRDLARVVSGAAERQALTRRLQRAAFTDSLTGLHNRHALDRHLTGVLEKANVERSRVAVLFCDLDGFKLANDRHGHEWGDNLLVHLARHLDAVLGEGVFVARQGGDEFVAVLERAPEDAALRALARRVREEFDPEVDDVVRTAVTVGVAAWQPGDVVDPAALLREADLAMLEGKQSHAGVALFDSRLRARMSARATARHELEAGIRDGEIVAHFQPLTDALTLEVIGLEVLARWRRDGRLRRPAEWLPLAEETGLVVEIGRQMFVAARAGMERFDLPVAVNVAARQLDEADFVRDVERSWGTDRWDMLTIEVTESALLYDAAHVRSSLATLVERGAKIALDDFGTGYNSLSRLGELPIQVLKIDRTFVHDIATPEGAAVLRAILALADAHGLEVVAEGVERAAELTALIDMGVPVVQGHMLGRPSARVPVRGRRPLSVARQPDTRADLYDFVPVGHA